MIITLPWPSRDLSPNARTHWAKKAKSAKSYRAICGWETKAAMLQPGAPQTFADGKITLSIIFHAKTRRAYDLDNALASIKSGLDGVADALGVDDSRWALRIEKGEPVRGGMIIVKIEIATEQPHGI